MTVVYAISGIAGLIGLITVLALIGRHSPKLNAPIILKPINPSENKPVTELKYVIVNIRWPINQ